MRGDWSGRGSLPTGDGAWGRHSAHPKREEAGAALASRTVPLDRLNVVPTTMLGALLGERLPPANSLDVARIAAEAIRAALRA